MSGRRHRLVPLLLVLVASCSSSAATAPVSPTRAPAAASTDGPCSLLTPDEVAGVFGAGEPSSVQVLGGSGWIEAQCEWTLPGATVSVAVGSSTSLAAKGVSVPLAQYVADRRATESRQFPTADLDGIGDGGYLLAGRAPTALVFKGDVLLQLIAFSPAGAVSTEVARTLVARATERVGR